jgi:hypothetical protein
VTKRFKRNKALNLALKSRIDEEKLRYSELEERFGSVTDDAESEAIVEEMQVLLEAIENDMKEWKERYTTQIFT